MMFFPSGDHDARASVPGSKVNRAALFRARSNVHKSTLLSLLRSKTMLFWSGEMAGSAITPGSLKVPSGLPSRPTQDS